jgi:hypothetical protein
MESDKQLPGKCASCGESFTFPVDALGTSGECPLCGEQTKMFLAIPDQEPDASRKMILWTVVGIVVLIALLFAALFAVHLARKLTDENRRQLPAQTSQPR